MRAVASTRRSTSSDRETVSRGNKERASHHIAALERSGAGSVRTDRKADPLLSLMKCSWSSREHRASARVVRECPLRSTRRSKQGPGRDKKEKNVDTVKPHQCLLALLSAPWLSRSAHAHESRWGRKTRRATTTRSGPRERRKRRKIDVVFHFCSL